ncbi:MAG TPA: hypothetical protein PKE04_08065, partial [Clostridia bacterium]|nr:hypothetical protein [Clostridia bacterium]
MVSLLSRSGAQGSPCAANGSRPWRQSAPAEMAKLLSPLQSMNSGASSTDSNPVRTSTHSAASILPSRMIARRTCRPSSREMPGS